MDVSKKEPFHYKPWQLNMMYAILLLGVVGLSYGFLTEPKRVWANLLVDGFYFVTIPVLGIFLISVLTLTGARWSEALRRVPEAIMGFFPVAGLLMLLTLFGIKSIYLWSDAESLAHHHALSATKAAFLSPGFFAFRMTAILLVWLVFSWLFRKLSLDQDQGDDGRYQKRSVVFSVIFVFVFAYTFSLACFDWIMSIEPHWTSTMFAVYNFSGAFVSVLAVVTLTCVLLHQTGYLTELNENHFHDLGKLLFAFSFFWAYIWFCQFMLIWYANIPEETSYYVRRLTHDWNWLFYFNFFLNFIVPFFVLLPRASKRSPAILKRVSIALLIGHWLDLYLLVAPDLMKADMKIGFVEVVIALGYGALFMLVVGRLLGRMPILPQSSPFLAQSLHYHQ